MEQPITERRHVNARLVLALLVVANILVFGYQLFTPNSQADAGARIEELQINPGRIRIQGVATRGPGSGTASARTGAYQACLEWGPFTTADLPKAESALAKLALSQPPMQRSSGEAAGGRRYSFFVPDPDNDKAVKIAELQRSFAGTEIKAGPCPS